MFTREKNRVDPAGRAKGGKTKKPAWETLLSSQAKELAIREHARAWRRRISPGLSDESDDDPDEYDRLNTSVSPNASFKHSRSMTAGHEGHWKGRRRERSDKRGDRLSHSWGPNNFQQSNGFPNHFQQSNGFHNSNGFLSSSNNKDVEEIWANAKGRELTGSRTDFIQGDFQFHSGYPPIPHKLVSKIQRGRYVNFQEMVAENLGGTAKGLKTPIDETDRINDVSKWVDCMAIYISIIAQTNPERVQDLLVYQSHIMRLMRVSHDKKSWQRYDVAFRRKAAQNGMTTWGNVDENLWILACSEEARQPVTCRPCMSVLHDDKTCPIAAMNRQDELKAPKKKMWGSRSLSPSREPQGRSRSASPNRSLQLPKEGLELKFAFGYHGYNACNNLFYTQSNEMVFHVAALGIVYSPVSHQQRFYNGHTDDILCLTIHDTKDYVATGQVGRYAETHIWDAMTMRTVARLKGVHKRGIICVDFSGDGKKLADVGLDDDHLICVWDWRKEEKLASTRGHKDMIFVLEWNPFNPNYFVSVGEKHIKFWTHNGSKIDKRPVTFGKAGTAATMLCVCHSPIDDLCFAGSDNGTVYVWQGTTLRRTVQAHKGPVCAMYSMCQSKNEGYVTGGRDGVVVMWDKYFEQCLKAFKVENSVMTPGSVLLQDLPPIRSIHTDEDKILIGTGNDEIIEIGVDGRMTIVVQGHGEGEVWGLDTHPMKNECVTVSDDKTLRVWDLNTLLLKKVKKLKKGGRAVAYSPDGGSLAVGQNDGGFLILEESTLDKVVGYRDRKEEISDIKFSPDGKFLAVGSHDNYVDVYSVKRGKRTGVCKGSSSYITHLDWDVKGRLIQTNSGAREHLFFEAPHIRRQTLTNDDVEKIDWATFTCVLGPMVKGVYPPLTDVTDVNATARSHDQVLLASGDDFGMVKLFNFPVFNRGARYRQYNGHSSHVTNVRWTHDDRVLVSTGGLDTAVLVWERVDIHDEDDVEVAEDKVFVQPKFLPTGPVRDPLAKGKPQFD